MLTLSRTSLLLAPTQQDPPLYLHTKRVRLRTHHPRLFCASCNYALVPSSSSSSPEATRRAFGRPSRSPRLSLQNIIISMGVMSFMKRWVAKRSASFMSAATLCFLGIGMSEDESAMAAAAEDLAALAAAAGAPPCAAEP